MHIKRNTILTAIHTYFAELQGRQISIIMGFIDAYPAAKNFGRTCEVSRNTSFHWVQLLVTDGIVPYFLPIITNTNFKILLTFSWKCYVISEIISTIKLNTAVVVKLLEQFCVLCQMIMLIVFIPWPFINMVEL